MFIVHEIGNLFLIGFLNGEAKGHFMEITKNKEIRVINKTKIFIWRLNIPDAHLHQGYSGTPSRADLNPSTEDSRFCRPLPKLRKQKKGLISESLLRSRAAPKPRGELHEKLL